MKRKATERERKMQAMNELKFSVAACLASASAVATDFVMTNVTDRAPSYQAAANYLGGVAPGYATADGRGDAVYATNRIDFAQTLTVAQWNPTTDATVFGGTLHGDACRQLDNGIGYANRSLVFTDLAAWPGLVYHSFGNMYLSFSPGEGQTATLPFASFEKKARVGVTDRNATLAVGRSIGKGVHVLNEKADATAPGLVSLDDPLHGPSASFVIDKGDVRIAGTPTEAPTVVGVPALHLDASAGDVAFETTDAADRTFVDRWYDCRGREGYPSAYALDARKKPFLATDDESGRRVVDFGVSLFDANAPMNQFLDGASIGWNGYWGDTLGKVGFLSLSEPLEGIREVFVVLREASHFNGIAPFLGADADEPQAFARGILRNSPLQSVRPTLFASAPETDGVKLGDIRVDGCGVRFDDADDRSRAFHVLSVGLALPAKARHIGTNGKYVCKQDEAGYARGFAIGGFRLAEMIVYTNALTSAERTEVNRYLRQKWQAAGGGRDLAFGELQPATGRSVEVPSGELRVGKLTVPSGTTLVKRGAGTLSATLATTNAFSLAVEGGAVAFGRPDLSADPQPAAAPDTWFRADDADSMTLGEADDGGRQAVTEWRHCEADGKNANGIASRLGKVCGADPQRYRDPELASAYVVDLGEFAASETAGQTASFLTTEQFRESDEKWYRATVSGGVRTGFIVCRSSDKAANILSCWGDSMVFRSDTGALLAYPASNLFGNYFALDGLRIAPDATVIPDGEWHLVSFRLATEANLSAVGGRQVSGTSRQNLGGLRVAERIQYARELTDEEFRETEAYLLRKYFGKSHPDAETAAAPVRLVELTLGEEASGRVASDRDLAVGTLACAGTGFEKAGAGAMSVAALPANVRDVTVSGGSLSTRVDWLADAFFHVDASDAASVVCAEGGNAVDRWYDVRGNGLYASSETGTYNHGNEPDFEPATYETASDTVGTNLVAGSRFIDFGTRAGMYWHRDGQDGAVVATTMRELHMVFCVMAEGNYVPVGHREWTMLPSGGLQALYNTNEKYYPPVPAFSPKLTDDGSWRTDAYCLDSKARIDTNCFYVISLSLTNAVAASSFGIDRVNCGRGNVRLCEVIIFNDATNTLVRCEAIHNHLMRKWLGKGEQRPLPISYDSITVADDATLSLDIADEADVVTGSLAGGGTLNVGRLTVEAADGGELARRFDAPDALACLTANGALTLPSVGRVVLSSAAGVRPAPGYYPILKAASLAGVERSGWTLDATGASPKRAYGLVFRKNEIGIRVRPLGFAILIR